jgi:hypothetical protein
MFTIVHINRLKKAYVQESEVLTPVHSSKVQQRRKKSKSDNTREDSNQEILPEVRTRASVDENSNDSDDIELLTAEHTNPVMQGQDSPQRKPSLSHSRRKSSDNDNSKEIAYQLRSRTVYEPEQEAPCIVNPNAISDSASVVNTTPHSEIDMSKITHSYNLRKRM